MTDLAIREAREARLEESRRAFAKLMADPSLVSLGKGDKVSTAAIEKLKLTPEEVIAIERVLTDTKETILDDFIGRLRRVGSSSSDPDAVVYYARAREDRGKAIVEQLRAELSSVIGEDRSDAFAEGIHAYSFFGGFGRHDIQMSVPASQRSVYVEYINPQNGRPARYGEYSRQEFDTEFGNILERIRAIKVE